VLYQVGQRWVVVAKVKQSEAARVASKTAKRECLVPDCHEPWLTCGLCRGHYDAAEHAITSQNGEEARARARDRLIRDGLMLEPGSQPRKPRKGSKAGAFRAAIAG
jgi:hypothetical protein